MSRYRLNPKGEWQLVDSDGNFVDPAAPSTVSPSQQREQWDARGRYSSSDSKDKSRETRPPEKPPWVKTMADYRREAKTSLNEKDLDEYYKQLLKTPQQLRSPQILKTKTIEYGPRGGRFTRNKDGYRRYF
jgi:ribosomal protein L19E